MGGTKPSATLSADVNAGVDFNVSLEKSRKVARKDNSMKDKPSVQTKVDKLKVDLKAKASVVVRFTLVLALALLAGSQIAKAPTRP